VSRGAIRLTRLMAAALVIVVVGYVVIGLRARSILQPTLRAAGEPDTAEVAIRVRNVFGGPGAATSTCNQPSAGHWTCSVRAADGRKGIASAVWYGRTEKLRVSSLDSAGFR
jgi:hypothetical protein